MSNIAISVENLGKRYRIGHAEKRSENFRAAVRAFAAAPFAYLRSCLRKSSEDELFWALKDVSFEVKHGEVLGIIGRNGAGKSTLLKILSRITEPTEGRAKIYGRIGSLLEVGTGFHPELTGRENIYLNGTILGMRRAEIARKFDEIVAFAEIIKFLDTPVKRYSSGMYVRLAFAVAAHFEPEILLVDEVLAVGDIAFQKKCLGKIKDVSSEGRTVLFVSHHMPTITSLCQKCILLDSGMIAKIGETSDVILSYYTNVQNYSPAFSDFTKRQRMIGDEYAILFSGSVLNAKGEVSIESLITEPVKIYMKYRVLKHSHLYFVPNLQLHTADGFCVFATSTKLQEISLPGDYVTTCQIPGNFLNEGTYFIGLALSSFNSGFKVHFHEPNALMFNVKDPIEGISTRSGYSGPMPGVVRPQLEWSVEKTL